MLICVVLVIISPDDNNKNDIHTLCSLGTQQHVPHVSCPVQLLLWTRRSVLRLVVTVVIEMMAEHVRVLSRNEPMLSFKSLLCLTTLLKQEKDGIGLTNVKLGERCVWV